MVTPQSELICLHRSISLMEGMNDALQFPRRNVPPLNVTLSLQPLIHSTAYQLSSLRKSTVWPLLISLLTESITNYHCFQPPTFLQPKRQQIRRCAIFSSNSGWKTNRTLIIWLLFCFHVPLNRRINRLLPNTVTMAK